MDYFVLSTLCTQPNLTRLMLSYDIACQWHKNLSSRMSTYPPTLRINLNHLSCTFLVLKFHLPAHIESCQTAFSFNLTKGAAWTDGEAPERTWGNVDPLAPSTKEMGPGSRRDTLDDHYRDWNHKKIIHMGKYYFLLYVLWLNASLGLTLARKLWAAIPQRDELLASFIEFDNSLKADPDCIEQLDKWMEELLQWESDNTNPNPYVIRRTRVFFLLCAFLSLITHACDL